MKVILSILILLYALPASAEFPYADPYYSTLTAGIVKADERDTAHRAREFSFKIIPERNQVPLIGARNNSKSSYWRGNDNAPLMIMMAGLGGSSNSTTINYLAYQFNKRGYHVLTIASPFHWVFSLSASTSAYPGITSEDTKDIYKVIELSLNKIRSEGISFSQVGLLGISMGALEAGYLSVLDQKEQKVGISRTLMINPPVDVFYGIDQLDALYAEKKSMPPEQRDSLKEKTVRFFASAITKDIKHPSYFEKLEERFPTTLSERKFVIGQSMREFLYGLIFATQQIKDRGVLKNPIATTDPNPRLEECGDWSFKDYMEKLLIPEISERRGHPLTKEEIVKDSFIHGIENELKENQNVYLMHNEDDFIVDAAQLSYLQTIFGMRMRLYKHGGHVGNLWYPENLEAILSTFQNLN